MDTPDELAALRAAGRVVAEALRAMRGAVRAGVTTGELDRVAADVFRRRGARSGPQLDYGFPGATCISVNDEAVHGIPGPRRLRPGDLVKLDVTAELDGFYADACVTVAAGRPRPSDARLTAAAGAALARALEVATAGAPVNAIGAAVEDESERHGVRVCEGLMGHGIGRRIHEPPLIPNQYLPHLAQPLSRGLVMTVEPILSAGNGRVKQTADGWTIRTVDGARAAHVEHTVVLTDDSPVIITA